MQNYRHRSGLGSKAKTVLPPPFSPANLQLANFRWITQDNWDVQATLSFARSRMSCPSQLALPPAFSLRSRFSSDVRPLQVAGRWQLLIDGATEPAAWAEVQCQKSSFNRLLVFVGLTRDSLSGARETDHLSSEMAGALRFLVSGLIIQSDADLIRLIPLDERLVALSWNVSRSEIFTLSPFDSYLATDRVDPLVSVSTYEIASRQWWEDNQADKDSLRYLIKRKSRAAAAAAATPSRRRHLFEVLLSRFLRRKR